MTMTRNVLLMILDGWGIGDGSKSDAIRAGHPVFIEELTRSTVSYTHLTLPTTEGV